MAFSPCLSAAKPFFELVLRMYMMRRNIIGRVLLGAVLAALGGCQSKRVVILTEPAGAKVVAQAVRTDRQPTSIDLGVTPIRRSLEFGGVAHYELSLTLPLHNEAKLKVAYEPRKQTEYRAVLDRYASLIDLVRFDLTIGAGAPKPQVIRTQAMLDVVERSAQIKGVTRITANESPDDLIGKAVLSPTDDVMVYEVYDRQVESVAHAVAPGETWTSIASAYGVDESTLRSFELNNDRLLKPGRTLRAPRWRIGSNLYRQRIGAFARTRITEGVWRDLSPAFCADGAEVVFSSNRGGPNHFLWRKRLDGSGGVAKLTSAAAQDDQPCVSPDNQRVAYVSLPPGAEQPQIWTVQIDGALPSQMREGRNPQWSPDGTQLLFLRPDVETGHMQLWRMDIDGANETQLTQNRDHDIADPAWSPDGKWIVLASNKGPDERGRRNWDIYLMSVQSHAKTRLTTNGSWDDGPTFDRHGRYIYFRSNRGGVWNIWRLESK